MGSNTICILKLAAGTARSEVLIQFPWVYLSSENNDWIVLGRVKVEEYHTWLRWEKALSRQCFPCSDSLGFGQKYRCGQLRKFDRRKAWRTSSLDEGWMVAFRITIHAFDAFILQISFKKLQPLFTLSCKPFVLWFLYKMGSLTCVIIGNVVWNDCGKGEYVYSRCLMLDSKQEQRVRHAIKRQSRSRKCRMPRDRSYEHSQKRNWLK